MRKFFRCISSLISIWLVVALCQPAFALPSYVHEYATVPFDEAYSNGYIEIWQTPSWGSGVNCINIHSNKSKQLLDWFYNSVTWPDDYCIFYGTNRTRDENVYLDHPGGAVMNGDYYDIREYVWYTGGTGRTAWVIRPDGYCYDTQESHESPNQTHRELHFYTAGHCGDPNYEVNFKGIMTCRDLDGEAEGYTFDSGYRGVWATANTTCHFYSETKYCGTGDTSGDNDNGGVWVEFESSPGNPLIFQYWTTGWPFGSAINFYGSSIHYNLVETGWGLPSGASSRTMSAARYGTYRFLTADNMPYYDGWEFKGWYWDEGLTNPVPATTTVTSDLNVYGTYVRTVFPVTTSVTNGSITPTNNEVRAGTDYTVYYSPNSGYLLSSVVVDGTSVDINSYPDSYTFTYLTSAHDVAVIYSKPTSNKTWALFSQS